MNPLKLFLKLSILQKVLFCIATFMFVANFKYFIDLPIFDKEKINGIEQSVSINISDIEIDEFDTYKTIEIEKKNFNSTKFDSVLINYSNVSPYMTIKYRFVSDFIFSKLWFCKILVIFKMLLEEIILLLILLIILAVKKENSFNKTVIKFLNTIALFLILLPIITYTKEHILIKYLHENLYGNLSNIYIHSKAQNLFYPLFFALVIFILIDVFKKGNKIEQENDLTI